MDFASEQSQNWSCSLQVLRHLAANSILHSKIQDALAKNLGAILELPSDQCNQSILSNELKSCDKYDNSFTHISNMICSYKHTPSIETHAGHSANAHHYEDDESDDDLEYRDARERPKSTPQIKFAPIKLPQFSGDVTTGENNFADWISLFHVSVNNIEDDAIKHIYLMQSLKGKAKNLSLTYQLQRLVSTQQYQS